MTDADLLDLVSPDWPDPAASVVVTDPVAAALPAAGRLLAGAAAVHVVEDRPTLAEADAIVAQVTRTRVRELLGAGSGVAMDTAKLAALALDGTGARPALVAVPCGPEPYRAVTGFAMYDDAPGSRKGVYVPWFRASRVHLVAELLDQVDPATVALFAGDSLVHAVESLLSRSSGPASERHARRAASILVDQSHAARQDRSLMVEASMRAATAFELTKLGLAHALSRPMGIASGLSHDRFNLMLGPPVVRFWGDEVLRASALAEGAGLAPVANLWMELLDHYRAGAGLPAHLSETALTWADMEAALAWAPSSSGIPHLPRPLADGDLRRLVEAAWSEEETA